LQRVTWNTRRAWGKTPTSTALTKVRVTPSGTSFSDLQAVVHAWQPMHRVWSMTLIQRVGRSAAGAERSNGMATGVGSTSAATPGLVTIRSRAQPTARIELRRTG
jgi:hypothetical protein